MQKIVLLKLKIKKLKVQRKKKMPKREKSSLRIPRRLVGGIMEISPTVEIARLTYNLI